MSKTITLRFSDDEYKQVLISAQKEHRPISNFITHVVLNCIEDAFFVDPIEMAQIHADEKLQKSLKAGHADAIQRKGKFV